MLEIPISPVPAQTLSVVVANQSCQITLFTLATGLYFSLSVGGVVIKQTVICENLVRMLLDAQYEGFIGDFIFYDTQGQQDPAFAGLGARYQLEYLEASDLASF
jgi:hypothetical protein